MENLIQIILWKRVWIFFRSIIRWQSGCHCSEKGEKSFAEKRKFPKMFTALSQFVCRPENGRNDEGRAEKVNGAFNISQIDWLEFILQDFPSPKSYVKHVPQSLLVSVRPSTLPFRANVAVDFQFQSRAFRNCVSEFYEYRSKLPGSWKRHDFRRRPDIANTSVLEVFLRECGEVEDNTHVQTSSIAADGMQNVLENRT